MRLHQHLGGEGVGALFEMQALQQTQTDGPKGAVVAEAQAEEEAQDERQPVVADALMEGHAAAGRAGSGARR